MSKLPPQPESKRAALFPYNKAFTNNPKQLLMDMIKVIKVQAAFNDPEAKALLTIIDAYLKRIAQTPDTSKEEKAAIKTHLEND